jgi:6-phosphogluconate dehydrogenase (decarboxylating)
MTGMDRHQTEKLGYLGLGLMGLPMSRRLLNAGYDVTVWNRSADKAAALIEAGGQPARCGQRRQHHLHVRDGCACG